MLGFHHRVVQKVSAGTANAIATKVYAVEPAVDITFVETRVGDTLGTVSNSEPNFQSNINDPISMLCDSDCLYCMTRSAYCQ